MTTPQHLTDEAPDDASSPGDAAPTMAAAKAPRGAGSVPAVATVIAVLVVALGVVAIRDTFVKWGVLSGTQWTQSLAGRLGAVTPRWWVVPISVVLLLLALVLVLVALRPRPRRAVPLTGSSGAYLRFADLERLLEQACKRTDGVESARATVRSARKVALHVRSTAGEGDTASVEDAVGRSIAPTVEALDGVSVKTRVTPFGKESA